MYVFLKAAFTVTLSVFCCSRWDRDGRGKGGTVERRTDTVQKVAGGKYMVSY